MYATQVPTSSLDRSARRQPNPREVKLRAFKKEGEDLEYRKQVLLDAVAQANADRERASRMIMKCEAVINYELAKKKEALDTMYEAQGRLDEAHQRLVSVLEATCTVAIGKEKTLAALNASTKQPPAPPVPPSSSSSYDWGHLSSTLPPRLPSAEGSGPQAQQHRVGGLPTGLSTREYRVAGHVAREDEHVYGVSQAPNYSRAGVSINPWKDRVVLKPRR